MKRLLDSPVRQFREPRTANREPRTANREPRTANREPRTANREPMNRWRNGAHDFSRISNEITSNADRRSIPPSSNIVIQLKMT
ncbi:MAG TPA: hypothetical protein DDZ88_26190 [Verrucomicrobiales bacterium]|nr:hypothetical protein [Verrucomicrobiales bacterium]